eukprot:946932-Pyramimonas_sp.AAC.1
MPSSSCASRTKRRACLQSGLRGKRGHPTGGEAANPAGPDNALFHVGISLTNRECRTGECVAIAVP